MRLTASLHLLALPVLPALNQSPALAVATARNLHPRAGDVRWSANQISSAALVAEADSSASGLPLDDVEERTLLRVLVAALVALVASAIATRGNGSVPPPFSVLRELLAGGMAAVLGELLSWPVEVAKVRLQTKRFGGQQSSFLREMSALVRNGARAAAPGLVAGLCRALVYHGLRLGLFPAVKRALTELLSTGQGGMGTTVPLATRLLVGSCVGALGAALCNPFDLVKARMAVTPTSQPNSVTALCAIARDEGGTTALWRGASATIVRAALGSGAGLVAYDEVKRLTTDQLAHVPGLPVLLSTVASAAAYVTAAAPADLVKTRLMLSSCRDRGGSSPGKDGNLVQYTGCVDCLVRSVRADGLGVLFRGWGASFARLLPVLLLVFPLLELLRWAFGVGSF
jgi:hypothetical protein